jgi:hypothetical protein
MVARRRSTARRAPARSRGGYSRSRSYAPRSRGAPRRGATRRTAPQTIRLVIETAPANPVSRLGQVATPTPTKAKF